MSTKAKSILELARRKGFIRARDLIQHAIPTVYLGRLVRLGLIERVSRGLYRLPDSEVTEHYSLAEAAAKVPGGVVCLLSALNFHIIGVARHVLSWISDKLICGNRPYLGSVSFSRNSLPFTSL